MKAENKKVVKVLAISIGGILILTVITVLIVQNIRLRKAEREAGESFSSGDSGTFKAGNSSLVGSSINSFEGRTFLKTEIEKMQSFLFNRGAMAMNEVIVSSIRDTGGIDGKIGAGFKTAYNEAVRIGIIQNLDNLYTQAMKH